MECDVQRAGDNDKKVQPKHTAHKLWPFPRAISMQPAHRETLSPPIFHLEILHTASGISLKIGVQTQTPPTRQYTGLVSIAIIINFDARYLELFTIETKNDENYFLMCPVYSV